AILEFLGEQQGKKGAEHVAANGHVAAMVDWASGQHGLGLAEQLLDPQQVAVAQHDLKRGELGVGAQHIEPVKARVFGDPRLVDGEVLGRDAVVSKAQVMALAAGDAWLNNAANLLLFGPPAPAS